MPESSSPLRGPAPRRDPSGPRERSRRPTGRARPTPSTDHPATARRRRGDRRRHRAALGGRAPQPTAIPATVWIIEATDAGISEHLTERVRAALTAPDLCSRPAHRSPGRTHHEGSCAGSGAARCASDPDAGPGTSAAPTGQAVSGIEATTKPEPEPASDGIPEPAPGDNPDPMPAAAAEGGGLSRAGSAAHAGPSPAGDAEPVAATAGETSVAPARQVPCVLVNLGRGPVSRSRIEAAAAQLAPGGVAAVFTISHRDSGRLHDPRPALVTAATAAGLDYLQHIVTIRPHPRPAHRRSEDAQWILGPDVSLLRRPLDKPTTTPDPDLGPAPVADPAPVSGAETGTHGTGSRA